MTLKEAMIYRGENEETLAVKMETKAVYIRR